MGEPGGGQRLGGVGPLHVVELAAACALGGLAPPRGGTVQPCEVGLHLGQANGEEVGQGVQILKKKQEVEWL